MVLESFGFSWLWGSSSSSRSRGSKGRRRSSSSTSVGDNPDHKKLKKSGRTRADQVKIMNGSAEHDDHRVIHDEGYYPGLVNISGSYCFMNSTLQALASLSYLQPQIDAVHAKAEELDVPTPVIDELKALFRRLNTPRSSYHSIRPVELIDVLTRNQYVRANSLLSSREHQDAQELFQLLSECIKNETTAVDKEELRDRGLVAALNASPSFSTSATAPPVTTVAHEIGKSVFDGLTANRRSCVTCGYTEAVMHFPLDNWQLAVPRMVASCRLEDCLEEYTRIEFLHDCICRKCSMVATHRRLQHELKKLEVDTRPEANPSSSKKKRFATVRKMEDRMRRALEEGRIEEDIKDVRMEKVLSATSTKQAMIARPPPILALHINRSIFSQYAHKNTVRLIFPEVLDLTPYTTSGCLSTSPTSSISSPPLFPYASPSAVEDPGHPRSKTPTQASYAALKVIYRLSAVVCHYGHHSAGHYICYRRKPRSKGLGKKERWAPPVLIGMREPQQQQQGHGHGYHGQTNGYASGYNGYAGYSGYAGSGSGSGYESVDATPKYVFQDEEDADEQRGRWGRVGKGWLRISDDAVSECGIETVLQEGSGAFMIYYERAVNLMAVLPLQQQQQQQQQGVPTTTKMAAAVATVPGEVGVVRAPSSAGIAGIGAGSRNGKKLGAVIVEEGAERASTETLRPAAVVTMTNGVGVGLGLASPPATTTGGMSIPSSTKGSASGLEGEGSGSWYGKQGLAGSPSKEAWIVRSVSVTARNKSATPVSSVKGSTSPAATPSSPSSSSLSVVSTSSSSTITPKNVTKHALHDGHAELTGENATTSPLASAASVAPHSSSLPSSTSSSPSVATTPTSPLKSPRKSLKRGKGKTLQSSSSQSTAFDDDVVQSSSSSLSQPPPLISPSTSSTFSTTTPLPRSSSLASSSSLRSGSGGSALASPPRRQESVQQTKQQQSQHSRGNSSSSSSLSPNSKPALPSSSTTTTSSIPRLGAGAQQQQQQQQQQQVGLKA